MAILSAQPMMPPVPQSVPAVEKSPPLPLLSEQTKRRLKIGAIVTAVVLVVGLLLGYLYYSQPVKGSGSVSATTTDVGLEVEFGFTPSKGISPYRYSWSFGDSSGSSEQNPHHAYTSPSEYVVVATVWDYANKKTTWTTTVTVNPPPIVVGTVSPSKSSQSFNASFTAQGQSGTPDYSYYWQFGDGFSSSDQNPNHFYTTGNYTAVVVVKDAVAMTASWSVAIGVSPPSAAVTVTPSFGVSSLNATFSAQGHGGTPGYTYFWQFGDGTTSSIQNPTHYYSLGNYTARVTVTDSMGMTASWTGSVNVGLPLVAGLTATYAGGPGFTEVFTCTPDQGLPPYIFFWQFGDGQSSTVQNPSHLYHAGNYVVTLDVNDSIGETVHRQLPLSFA
jgi:PKD repeat protein